MAIDPLSIRGHVGTAHGYPGEGSVGVYRLWRSVPIESREISTAIGLFAWSIALNHWGRRRSGGRIGGQDVPHLVAFGRQVSGPLVFGRGNDRYLFDDV